MLTQKKEVIKFAKLLNHRKLSALRSGNISLRHKNGFLITPSGKKYSSLKVKDIVFVNLKGEFNNLPLNGDFIKIFIFQRQKRKQ